MELLYLVYSDTGKLLAAPTAHWPWVKILASRYLKNHPHGRVVCYSVDDGQPEMKHVFEWSLHKILEWRKIAV